IAFNCCIFCGPALSGYLGQGNPYRDYYTSRSRKALTVDTRTATEYGVVRTFGQADFQFDNFNNGTRNPSSVVAAPNGTGLFNSSQLSGAGGGYVAVETVFIEFAGFTFVKSAS